MNCMTQWLIFSCGGIRSYQEHCSSSSQEKQSAPKSKPFFLLAGPNVIESEEQIFRMAKHIKTIATKVGLPLVFKSSFDKANRTSSKLFRGPGMAEGLKILKKVKIAFDLPIVTNVHEFIQCEEVGKLSCRYHSDSCIFMPSDLLSCMVDLAGKDGIAKVGCQEVFICNKARFCSNEAMRATKLAKLDSLSKFLDVYC
ncbi:2-dehydro-3-deoxyphosphooctonate aldolase 1 isoform X2 [Rosa chinensis]|uniref:2-dehydro-3-deoxyphosphooctonate aldolase 1 isoform X2 n=1 Tax=Rosa chinensis TaxID=74649 RepID=UPI001AD9218C|nr:2-dehydro-3-deoxyphosphooctonate aldolase 1 isoform X2 [Rosa chinensis]XP_040364994.1 2-dehydro-3-deoxyphosphooctonate aldolase 1 isoform X2 [Rosa chinensis]XP_040364995.1 2-dehydro-3-deoxyphosphooctonate aldolase 1 isoform X2 [Rosa chinensis]XP_040364996.1 2-dehydro-3-deoxyphosphooctonate aldolase 1 isoform X2 [Rosa chinensis]XP_040364997.1 2-dehydro-3-deoxyphosphooctonate aldolase 1 isoform X2 [Rosa chinensis]XP_040364998.1 2-dehydro-3-deoxyphosphooctonate aldolase 1 isoform X2 [Rosa chin